MTEPAPGTDPSADEISRLNKIIHALMDRAERANSVQSSDFGLFQTTVLLEGEIRRRTTQLRAALEENRRVTLAQRASEARFRGIVEQSLVGIAIIEDGAFTYVNPRGAEIFGYPPAEFSRLSPMELAVPEDRPVVARNIERRARGLVSGLEYRFRGLRRDGEVIHLEVHSNAVRIDDRIVIVSLVLDITGRVKTEQRLLDLQAELREQSIRDPLTGLFNRRYLTETLSRELSRARRAASPLAVILLDIDHFKTVNDTHGHAAGDEVLKATAKLLDGEVRAGDVCCRYGGEEFMVVLPGLSIDHAAERAEQLRRDLEGLLIAAGGKRLNITASFGVAAFPASGQTFEALFTAADNALYEAKAGGRNRVRVIGEVGGGRPGARNRRAAASHG